MQNLTQQLQRIEHRLEMLGAADKQLFDFKTIEGKLKDTKSMTEYRLSLEYMNDEQGKGDLLKIKKIIGDYAALMFYDKEKKTCVILCNDGAYYCDYIEESVKAFARCWCKGKLMIEEASLQTETRSIVLTSIDDQKNYQQLKILLDKPYR